jgi:hypothetical protein
MEEKYFNNCDWSKFLYDTEEDFCDIFIEARLAHIKEQDEQLLKLIMNNY